MAAKAASAILAAVSNAPLTIRYLFTTFPKSTETFFQREITAMREKGVGLKLYSMWGGGGDYEGIPVATFSKWRLLELLWILPWVAVTRWPVFWILLRGLMTRKAPSWMNFWENMLGAGFAAVHFREFAKEPGPWIHAAWGGAPATAAWCLWKVNGSRYSAGAHAYDIYEYGGDWWLTEKLAEAAFVHTSTDMGKASLVARGVRPETVHVIRRGLARLPLLKALRVDRSRMRILCIARLVPKKGLLLQIQIYAALKAAGVDFQAVIVGDGPQKAELLAAVRRHQLAEQVFFTGHLSQAEVQGQLAWADVLIHTGVVARSGDRDGLPNVIPEAMAAGVLVITSAAAATTEAIRHGITGMLADVSRPEEWVQIVKRLSEDDELAERLRDAARLWVVENFDAHRNAAVLHALFVKASGAAGADRV